MRRGPSLLLALLPLVAQPALAQEPSIPRQAELRYLVKQDCGSCHGLTMKGGLGSPLLPERLKDRRAEDLARVILTGLPGTPMPSWAPILSEPEALWIARQLQQGL